MYCALACSPVKPHRVTTFAVADMRTTRDDDACLSWDWIISIKEDSNLNVLESVRDISDVLEYTFTKAGRAYGVEATCLRSKTNSLRGSSVKVEAVGKYVRRELRELTADDREQYLDAVHTVYTTRTEEGVKKYGFERFKGFEWFLSVPSCCLLLPLTPFPTSLAYPSIRPPLASPSLYSGPITPRPGCFRLSDSQVRPLAPRLRVVRFALAW